MSLLTWVWGSEPLTTKTLCVCLEKQKMLLALGFSLASWGGCRVLTFLGSQFQQTGRNVHVEEPELLWGESSAVSPHPGRATGACVQRGGLFFNNMDYNLSSV